MPTALTGTTAWTANVSTAGFGSSMRLGRGCVDASETYAYFPDRQTAGTNTVYRLTLSNQTWTQLYAPAFYANPVQGLALSVDETTLYGGTGPITGTAYIYGSNTDGTGTPTELTSWTETTGASAFVRPKYDAVSGRLLTGNSGRTFTSVVPGTWGTPVVFHWPTSGTNTLTNVTPARYDPDKILWSHDGSRKYLLEFSRRSGRSRVIAGDGSANAASTGSAYATPIGTSAPPDADSDSDGRIYYQSGSNVYALIDGTITQLVASVAGSSGNTRYMPVANALLVCDGTYTVRKIT